MKFEQYKPGELKMVQELSLDVTKEFVRICEKYQIPYFAAFGTALGAVRHNGFIPWDDDVDFGILREDFERFLLVAPAEITGKYRITGPETDSKYYNVIHNLNKIGTKFETIYDHGNFNIGVFNDIFIFDYTYDDPKKRRTHCMICNFWRQLYLFRNVNFAKYHLEGSGSALIFVASAIVHYLLILFHISPEWIYRRFYAQATKLKNSKSNTVTCMDDITAVNSYLSLDEIFPTVTFPFEDTELALPNQWDTWLTRLYHNYMQLPKEEDRQNHHPYYMDLGDYQ